MPPAARGSAIATALPESALDASAWQGKNAAAHNATKIRCRMSCPSVSRLHYRYLVWLYKVIGLSCMMRSRNRAGEGHFVKTIVFAFAAAFSATQALAVPLSAWDAQ